jgi:hypothetical protein
MPDPPPIERAFFRETKDGTTLFFPWGLAHRGHRLPDDAARRTASRATTLLIGSVIAIAGWAAHALEDVVGSDPDGLVESLRALAAPSAALLLAVAAYAVWAWRFVERCPDSAVRIPREERLREAAEIAPPWKVALVGVVTLGMSGLLVALEPRFGWLGGVGGALGAGLVGWAVVLRRAAAAPRLEPGASATGAPPSRPARDDAAHRAGSGR